MTPATHLNDYPDGAEELRRTADILGQLTRDSGGNDSRAVEMLTQQAVALIPAANWASVTVLRQGRFETMASNAQTAVEVDLMQYHHGTGPCVDAVLEDGIFVTGDVAREPRWDPLGRRLHERFGVSSMLALRLHLLDESDTIAGLNLSATRQDAFSEADEVRARLLATHCALLVTAVHAQEKASNLLNALESNREIGIAIGVLIARHPDLTREGAFDVLRHASQNSNRKLRDIAADVALTGAPPDTDPAQRLRAETATLGRPV